MGQTEHQVEFYQMGEAERWLRREVPAHQRDTWIHACSPVRGQARDIHTRTYWESLGLG